jgi:hypothetical protein
MDTHPEISFVGFVTRPGADFDYRMQVRIPGKTPVVVLTEDRGTDFLVYCDVPPLPGARVALRGVWFLRERLFPSGTIVCEAQLDVESWVELSDDEHPTWEQNFVELCH